MNEAVAVVGNNALVLDTEKASELELEIGLLVESANKLSVKDQKSADDAAELKKRISKLKKAVEAEWEPYRVQAKKAYDAVLAGKKEMVAPLEKAEKTVTGEINTYAYEMERKRLEREAAQRKALEEAMAAKLAEAARAETDGDAVRAEMAMAEAEVFDGLSAQKEETPKKLNGMTQKVGWEIVAMDASAVPVYLRAADGRFIPVRIGNKAVVEQLVRQAIETEKGNVAFPGVAFRETMKVNVR